MKRVLSTLVAAVLFVSMLVIPTGATEAQVPSLTLVEGTESPYGCPADNMFDGNQVSKWCLSACPCEVVFKTESPVSIVGYGLTNAEDNANNPGRVPEDWNLYGSADGTTWNLIHKVEDDATMTDENFKTFKFALESAAPAYEYYKLEITQIQNEMCVQISEINLYVGSIPEDPILYTLVDGTPSPHGCPPGQMIDGMTATKWCLNEFPCFVSFSVPEETAITGYTLTNGEDNEGNPGRTPDSWNLYGSKDGETWVKLHSVVEDDTMQDVNFAEYKFNLEATSDVYKYFKLEVLSCDNDMCLQISELKLLTPEDVADEDGADDEAPNTADYIGAAVVLSCASLGVVMVSKKRK